MNHPKDRDPIMNDESFSLRFGNPIQVIHDSRPSSRSTSPVRHVPHYIPTSEDEKNNKQHLHSDQKQPDDGTMAPPSPTLTRTPSSSNITRDVGSFADFYHSKEGRVDEIDHD
ncbi:hypothetical protein BC941DRAFT_412627 [Chlamydoabsidia padenii]|nr:hypothetical protein BC941DRAFT_412627 [Chlamydoabsidia padenii]